MQTIRAKSSGDIFCLYFQREQPQHEPCTLPARDFCKQTTEQNSWRAPFSMQLLGKIFCLNKRNWASSAWKTRAPCWDVNHFWFCLEDIVWEQKWVTWGAVRWEKWLVTTFRWCERVVALFTPWQCSEGKEEGLILLPKRHDLLGSESSWKKKKLKGLPLAGVFGLPTIYFHCVSTWDPTVNSAYPVNTEQESSSFFRWLTILFVTFLCCF